MMGARRALLYMPGDELRKIHKSTTLGVDAVCMDMEDGVAVNRKTEARQRSGQGAFALEGKMVDAPVMKVAQGVLSRTWAAGINLSS
jgi:citrate lyase beta subunit